VSSLHNPFLPFDRIERLCETHDLSTFDCGNIDFNDFIQNDALKDMREHNSVTYVGIFSGRPVAFVSLATAAYRAELLRTKDKGDFKYKQVSALKIARIATDRDYQSGGCALTLLDYCFAIGFKVRALCGCRLMVADALPDRIGWYEKRGFISSIGPHTRRSHDNLPMYAIF
jgi:GNAT superfamily N-acetyltransferase